MPVMDGVQLLTELKQIDRAKDIPVVSTFHTHLRRGSRSHTFE